MSDHRYECRVNVDQVIYEIYDIETETTHFLGVDWSGSIDAGGIADLVINGVALPRGPAVFVEGFAR